MFHHFHGLMLWTLPWSCGSFPNELDETKWGAHYGSMQINDSDSNIWRQLCNVRGSFLSSQHELCCWAAGVYLNSLISYKKKKLKKNITCTSRGEWDKWKKKTVEVEIVSNLFCKSVDHRIHLSDLGHTWKKIEYKKEENVNLNC